MKHYPEGLIQEEGELMTKIEAFYDYTQSNRFANRNQNLKNLAHIQLEAMRTYYRCLTAQISAIDEANQEPSTKH